MKPSTKQRSTSKQRRLRPIVANDLLRFVAVTDPQVAPDGTSLVVVRKSAGHSGAVESSLWIAPTDGSRASHPLTTGTKDTQPRFSPDGSKIAFVRCGSNKIAQIALLALNGGEASVLTEFPEGSFRSLAWSPDGRSIALSFRATEAEWTDAARKERERLGKSDPPRVLDARWHRLDGDGWFGAARHALFIVDAHTGAHRLVYDEDAMGHFDLAWSPDSRCIAIATNRANDALLKPWKTELLILDVAKRTLSPVPGLPIGPKGAVTWSPDGKRLAWAGRRGRDSAYSTENLELWTCGVPVKHKGKRGKHAGRHDHHHHHHHHHHPRSLTHQFDLCLGVGTLSDGADAAFDPTIRWSADSRTIYTRIGWEGEGHLVAIDLDGTAPRFLTRGAFEHVLGNLSSDGQTLAAIRTDPVTPAEAGVLALGGARATWKPLTNFNAALAAELDLSAPSEHWVTAEDGHRTQVWVMLPPKSAAKPKGKSKKRPGVLEIHGGPHAQYGVAFFHEFQLLAAQGYVVVYPNPRGSKGYGRDHCAAIRGSWGDRDWVDVQAVMQFMEQHPAIDAKRLGIMGGSYGGYMTNWAIAHTHVFKAAITDRCVSNMLSMSGNSDYVQLPDDYWIGTNFDRPETLWRASPIAHFKGVKTPTLIIHSEGDLRCNIEQAEQVHTALTLQDVPCRFVRYPMSTSHGMSRVGPPDLRVHRLEEILAWWRRWL